MTGPRLIRIPTLLRIKCGALDRVGVYARRHGISQVVLVVSAELPLDLSRRLLRSLELEGIRVLDTATVVEASFEQAQSIFARLPARTGALLGFGGGKALDTAKYVAFLARLPYLAVPTSLSNDGFASPQSSLTLAGRKRSLPSSMPFGIVIDTDVTRAAPARLWHSGVGDLLSKVTAVHDWRSAARVRNLPVDDFAAMLSDATVFQFAAHPVRDAVGEGLLANALMLNGVSMEVCGSSRPASGSEHLVSHALDALSQRPRLHGLQVGVATYLMSQLQGQGTELVRSVLARTGFLDSLRDDPMSRAEWVEAVRRAPSMKDDFHTVLSEKDGPAEVARILREDPFLAPVFTD